MNSKSQKIKEIVAKIDIEKITNYLQEHPNSKTLKEIIKHTKRASERNEEEKVFKLGTDLAYDLDTLAKKTDYVKNEEEKKY